ncbi:MAG: hypothetical protein ACRDTV_07225, partial [Mycobacterium sp.]
PGLRLVPRGWASRGDTLYVDWTMSCLLGGERVEWDGVDKFSMRGDRATNITAYFDTHPLWVRLDPSMERSSMIEEAARQSSTTRA